MIIDMLSRYDSIPISELAASLGVSRVTIYKDLDILESKGFLTREHGYARVRREGQYNSTQNLKSQTLIAKEAASLVNENETILLESGSCCTFLASELAHNDKKVNIVTNAVNIANLVSAQPHIRVFLLGGEYMPSGEVMVGSLTRRCAEVFFVDKFFVDIDGFTDESGFYCSDHNRSQTIRDLLRQAQSTIVMAESSNFYLGSICGQVALRPEEASMVITDNSLPPDTEMLLNNYHVEVRKIEA
jgi:DeoR/GlpR family transcriptional regulator of sugar metabolism